MSEEQEQQVYAILEKVAKSINNAKSLEVAIPGEKEVKADVKQWIPTASVILNLLMGDENYGVAVGRIYDIIGDFGEGKSTIAQIIMNAFQEAGGVSVLLDSESAWNRARAIDMGHNPKRHMAVDIETCEMGFSVIQETIEQFKITLGGRVPVVFVWDTISASPTDSEKKGDEFANGMQFKPRFIRSQLRAICPELKKVAASLVFVSQTIEGNKPNRTGVKTTAGGGGIKFWSSQRLQVEKVATTHDPVEKEKLTGIITNIKMVKNKLHPPFKRADVPIDFKLGLNPVMEVTNYLLDHTNVYNISGAYKSIVGFAEKDIKFYEKDLPKVLEANPGLLDWMVEQVKSHWITGSTF
jgi:recombination protein RecA